MKFKGDVIITDPCYIIKKIDFLSFPEWNDYISYNSLSEYPDLDENGDSKLFETEREKLGIACDKWEQENSDDWEISEYGKNLGALGIENYICRSTNCGDWNCATYDNDDGKEIGLFCADSAKVAVLLLDEVLKYNPKFNLHNERPWTTTLIKDFNGDIEIVEDKHGDVRVIGNGNINFYTDRIQAEF